MRMSTSKVYPKQTIYGDIVSKSNGYKIAVLGGHYTMVKTKAVKDYEREFYKQCSLRDARISGLFKITVDVYFKSNRKDLDGSFKLFLDALQTCGVIKNDRQCVEIHSRKLIDPKNPRVEFQIEEIELQ